MIDIESKARRFRLYIDESGDHTESNLENPNNRYLCLLGVFIEGETYRTSFCPALNKLKQDHFPHCPDKPVILHRRDLVDKRWPFSRLKDPDNEQRFNTDLLKFLNSENYGLIGVTIDKKRHKEKYAAAAYHPYHYCLAVLMERYSGFLNYYNAVGDIMVESRGGTEDRTLKRIYEYLHANGTRYTDTETLKKALTSRKLKLKPKEANILGLQIADLLAYDAKQQILIERDEIADGRTEFAKAISEILDKKYNRRKSHNQILGYGKVFLG